MTDSILVFPPGFRLLDASGEPLSGGKIKFYEAATTTTRTVYSDANLGSSLGSIVYTGSDGLPVASFGSSTAVSVYTGINSYKVVVTDDSDVVLFTLDNRSGALDTSSFLSTDSASTLSIAVVTKTSNYTLASSDRGKLVQCNTTGGNFTLTLPSSAALGDNWNVEIRNSGTSGQFILSSTDAVSFEGQTFTARAFNIGEGCFIRCDGAAFKISSYTPPLMASKGPSVIPIVSRVSSAPVSPTSGTRYIVSGAFSTYAVGDIIEYNGTSYNAYTPPATAGWIAFVQNEAQYYSWYASAWRDTLDVIATQAEMEAGSASNRMVTPARQKNHPAHPKLWVSVAVSGGTPALSDSHGVSSVTDDGTGDFGLTCSTAFSNSAYGGSATITTSLSGQFGAAVQFGRTSASIVDIKSFTGTSSGNPTLVAADYSFVALALGDQ